MFRSEGLSTLNVAFMAAVEAEPERVFLDFSGETFTYARMAEEVEKLSRGLHSLGVKPKERVVILLENGPDLVITWFAINRLGAILVPINTAYTGDFLCHQLNDCGARIVICEREFVDRVTSLASRLTAVEHLLHLGPDAEPDGWRGTLASLDAWRLTSGPAHYVDVEPQDLAAIIYTSGTTGLSKGCMASHNYLGDLSRRYAEAHGRTPEDILWSPLPLFHIAGTCVVIGAMQDKATGSVGRRFSVSGFWPEIERSGASMIMLMGSMAQMIANEPDSEASRRCEGQIRTLVATPMTPELAQSWRERFGVQWVSGLAYGSTECALALNARYDSDVPQGSCGRVNDAFEVQIVDEAGNELPPNQVGEIVVRPKRPHVMFSGYWKNPVATTRAWKNLWHHMGDRAKVDEYGNFYFADRSRDVIRRRGENISSFEMEMSFILHPDIAEVAIHAVPSEVSEDEVKATLVLRTGAETREADIHEWARERVPKFALPRFIEFRRELPKNPAGRVLKFQLREEGVTGSTWDSERGE